MRMNFTKTIAAATLCSLTALCAWGADAAAGKDIYATKCKTCHGADGQGNAGLAKALKVEMKPLTSAEVQAMSDADLSAVIAKGKGKMKPVALPPADVANVVAYVKTMKK
jgi:mono/diheme cytochrome c family protein